ncbi:MAG: DUF177 domain-containing protein [bacterium]|nr:DUF177 domain-containing protein [bacterium]MDZ4248301.1 DUF177 domain-containing protein [Patescibacteria group bacterium]
MITVDLKPLAGAAQGASVPLEVQVRHPKLKDLPKLSDLAVTGTVSKLDEGYLVAGTLQASIRLECARCLKPFDHPLSLEFSEQFSLQPDDDRFPAQKGRLELDPMLRTVILIRLPERPMHDPGCKGLCPTCGKDLNLEPHEHPKPESDEGPFDQLKKLR